MRVGTHCSVQGGLSTALEIAVRLGCDTLQIFTHAPRIWRSAILSEDGATAFNQRRKDSGLMPLVVHAPYLPNLCTSDAALYQRSQAALHDELEICRRIDAEFLVLHPGSYSEGSSIAGGLKRLVAALNLGLRRSPGPTRILVENMAGGGRRLGSSWVELAAILEGVKNKARIGMCLDTAHTLGAGHGFSNAQEVAATLTDLDHKVGLRHVHVIHANDSKAARGSHRDLHEHIGKGHVGLPAFRALLNDPRLAHCVAILETPKDDALKWDLMNLAALRRLQKPAAATRSVG